MQEVLIFRYCDRCFQADQAKVEATAVEVAIGEQRANLDLCDPCGRELIDPVRALLKVREAAQRALSRSTTARQPQPGRRSRCQCGITVEIRQRAAHARDRHDGALPQDLKWVIEGATEVWECSCDLPFPTFRGLGAHARRTGHSLPPDQGPTRLA